MPHRKPLLLWLGLVLGACSAPGSRGEGSREEARERMKVSVYDARAKLTNTTFGAYLVQLDNSIQAWTAMFISGDRVQDAHKLRALAVDIGTRAGKLYEPIVEALETGPPHNRRVCAAALGFVPNGAPLNPLLNALGDEDELVRANALLALAVLGDPTTPLGAILEQMGGGATVAIRSNAALALIEILRAGGKGDEGLVPAARLGLHDEEPLVRTQCALILAHQQDAASIDDLALQLYHDPVNAAAMAAGRALAYLGSRDPHVKGRCARALAASLGVTNATVRSSVLNDLRKLAQANFGSDEDWVTWSQRLD